MTTRSRPRPRGATYTARLHQRTAAPRPVRRHWSTARTQVAALALLAEGGHLIAAFVEWPAMPARGLFHVLTAAVLGLVSALVYCGRTRWELIAGITVGLAIPATWLGAVFGLSPYVLFPVPAAVALSIVSVAIAAQCTRHHSVS